MDFSRARILCLGDIMLDRFAYCGIERISPEAPVPVLLVDRWRSSLGGAGNVARNIATLGGEAVLVGLFGCDTLGIELQQTIREMPRLNDALVKSASRPTTCKTRYVAGHQQIMRVDEERSHALDEAEQKALLTAIDTAIRDVDAVILSDYGKGVLNRKIISTVMSRARARHIPVFVDPKRDGFRFYRGATCITPNLMELGRAAKMPVGTDAEVIGAATRVLRDAQAEAILATRSEKGMMLVEASGEVHVESARAREVFDVSGAGDTVIAVLALAHASGHPLSQAMRLANTAAGIVVGKLGTAAVELDELILELSHEAREHDVAQAKFYTAAEAETLVRQWRSRGLSVGFTNGCFDIVHPGHVRLLAKARLECDRLVVALNSDGSVSRLKGPERPINTLADRAAVIAALASVDAVISFEEDTPLNLITKLKPEVLIKGGDYTIDTVVGAEEVQATGGRVALIDLVEGHSTTRTIGKMTGASRPVVTAVGNG
ncbi:MAG TPA: D-glycero-beta-D-manno-heptose-7-phosphate kinase [Stellaceae bacterium]|nr:D-glycero-beta-D-manno-heptose-7-phosphate kinase [Stellaceae bacterium]